MAAKATLRQSGRVAVLSLSRDPDGMPAAEAVCAALAAPQTAALVLGGRAAAFSAAASPELCDTVAAAGRPVIAACSGEFEDGAVELALAAAYRLAAPGTTFAFPGIGAGRLPRAGGIHRLVRCVGVAEAAALLLHPRTLTAAQAERAGLVDGVARGGVEAAAVSLARRLAGAALGPRAAAHPDGTVMPLPDAQLARRAPLAVATLQACLAAAARDPAAAPRHEAARVAAYADSAEAAALSRLARSRAAVAPPPGTPEAVERIAVSGLAASPGTLAPAFVHALARSGIETCLVDPPEALGAARTALPPGAAGWIRATWAAAGRVDLALECSSEGVVARFASGAELALALAGPGPGPSLVEAVPTRPDSAGAMRALGELCRRAGVLLVCHDAGRSPCAPALRGALFDAAAGLLEEGWTPQALDDAALAAGLPAGPCAQEDAVGLGPGVAGRAAAAPRRDPRLRYVAVADRLHGAGRAGRRAGAGFHRYAGAFAAAERDPAAEALIAEARRDAGSAAGVDLSPDAAARVLLGAVERAASDGADCGLAGETIDLVAVEAGLFPARLGGPLHTRAVDVRGSGAALNREGRRP